jgi:3-hydroxybutyryl-CoA dehydrogenase
MMRAGHQVVLHDFSVQTLTAAHNKINDIGRSIGVSVRAEPSMDAAVEAAEFVVEAVTENLALKQSIFQRAGAVNRQAILMSNSSVLPIGEIARRIDSPERAVGTHWWNPPQLIPIVEVIRGPRTGEDVMNRTMEFHEALGKMPVRVDRDVPGFLGNRIQHALWREALALVSAGECDAQSVDRIVGASLGKVFSTCGPWEQMERIGWPQIASECANTLPLINSDPWPSRLLRDKVAQGQLGAKSGQGFLRWEPGEREQAAARLSLHVTSRLQMHANKTEEMQLQSASLSNEDAAIARRLQMAVWREAIALVAHKVCSSKDVDRVVLNTIGLRLAAMGPLENADYVGLDLTLAIHEAVLPSLEISNKVPALVQSHGRLSE